MKIALTSGEEIVKLSAWAVDTLRPGLEKDAHGHLIDKDIRQVFLRGVLGMHQQLGVNLELHAERCRPYLALEVLQLVKNTHQAGLREGAAEMRRVLGIAGRDTYADNKSPKLAFEQRDPRSEDCEFLHEEDMKRYIQKGPYRDLYGEAAFKNPIHDSWDLYLMVDGEVTLISRGRDHSTEELTHTASRIWLTLEEVYQSALTDRLGRVNAILRNAQAEIDAREAEV